MDIQREGRQLALAFMNLDDLVFARELSGSGLNLLAFAGRSLVGTAVVGAGLATRTAVFGAQVATKSALAVAGIAKGRVPGAALAEQLAYDLDQSVGRGGEAASFIASQGVAIAKADRQPPAEPIFGDAWLGKRLRPGATPNAVLIDSAIDLTRLAALPLTFSTATLANALATTTGQQVTRSFWQTLSTIVDSVRRSTPDSAPSSERSERRAVLLLVGLAPLMAAAQDIAELVEGLSRATAGDGAQLRDVLTRAIARIEADSKTPEPAHTPERLLSALAAEGNDAARVSSIGRALIEDSGTLSRLAVAYASLLGGLLTSSLQSAMTGALDVDAAEAWVRNDEAARTTGGAAPKAPESVRQLESLVAGFVKADAGARQRGFFVPGTIEMALDTIFGYSTRAIGRETALARMERLFGTDVRERLADDCSLRGEIIDAKKDDRDRRIAALVAVLEEESAGRLREARRHAGDRLASLTATSPDRVLERLAPQRIADRITILQRFIGMADTTNALAGMPSPDGERQQVLARFNEWIATSPAPGAKTQPV